MVPILIAGGIATAVAMFGRRLGRLQVTGDSMQPTLEAGERVVILRTRRVRPGHIAVVADPRSKDRLVVKRVVGVSADGFMIRGDNPAASTDSRHFGPVDPAHVKGRVLYRYHPASRRGRVAPVVR